MLKVLFIAGNSDTQLKSYLPVIKNLNNVKTVKSYIYYNHNFPVKVEYEDHDILDETKNIVSDFVDFETSLIYSSSKIFFYNVCKEFQKKTMDVICRIKPNLIVIPNHKNFRNRCVAKIGSLKGIPVIVLQDALTPGGMGNWASYPWSYKINRLIILLASKAFNSFGLARVAGAKALYKYNFGHKNITKIAVWGERSKYWAKKQGYEDRQIEITGQPRFDEIINNNWKSVSSKLYKSLGIDESEKKVVFLPTAFGSTYYTTKDENINILREMVESIKKVSKEMGASVRLIIKLHRKDSVKNIREIYPKELLEDVVLLRDVSLYALLNESDVAITSASTAGLEALIMKKPLIILNLSKRPDYYDYVKRGAATGIYNHNDLESVINKTIFNTNNDSHLLIDKDMFLKSEIFKLDGEASSRVAKLVLNSLQ